MCSFVSHLAYDGRLGPSEEARRRDIVGGDPPWSGTGVRFVRVDHDGDRTSSTAEAEVVAEIHASLRAATFLDEDGSHDPIGLDDVLVVAPYNA